MKNLEMIVSDLDGTLVSNDVLANKTDIDMLKTLQAQDFKLVVATGRSWQAAHEMARCLGVNNYTNLVICNNGAVVSKVSEYEPLLIKTVETDIANELLSIANNLNLCFYAFKASEYVAYWNGIACPSENLQKINWVDSFSTIDIKNQIDDEEIIQVMIFVPDDLEKTFLQDTSELRKKTTNQKNDHEDVSFYEFNNATSSKGNAVKFVANLLKVDLKNAIVFGDNYNDISMFEVVGTSIAMGNASQTVKNKATDETGSVSEAGVSMYLNQMIMNMDGE